VDGGCHYLRCPRRILQVRSRRYPPDHSLFSDIFLRVISTIQFVGISAFHTRISDPAIGGTYMTVRLRSFLRMALLRLTC